MADNDLTFKIIIVFYQSLIARLILHIFISFGTQSFYDALYTTFIHTGLGPEYLVHKAKP